ncbi:WecB/TagA/CpsF family glycosyltransferase [Leptolyngbya sp. GB1-A1]|uniref:WecB/TagA/CpsF family glycosyltransferase n=1 Tax=Leptolyngbya sp. GB1-A1 TaxID=2933908 RepID=UPI003298FAAA
MPDLLQAPRRSTVLGLPIHLVSDYPGWLLSHAKHHCGVHVVTLNAEMAMQAEKTPDLAAVIRKAELVIPDGSGVVLYLRLRGMKVQRCPGIELAEKLINQMPLLGSEGTVFFYGGAPGVAQAAADRLQQHIPKLKVVGVQHGYLSAEERSQLNETLQQLQPRLILVGLGVPRQELWIAEHRYLCPDSIWIGVGGSFDIWSGKKTRAPRWLANNHLEWVYRLYQEPWRWRRMLALPRFALRALLDPQR